MMPLTSIHDLEREDGPDWVPYVAGFALGIVVLLAVASCREGLEPLNAAAALTGTPEGVGSSLHPTPRPFGLCRHPAVFLACGIVFGALLSALHAGRAEVLLERGDFASPATRILFALVGGGFVGYAGCLGLGSPLGRGMVGVATFAPGCIVYVLAMGFGAWVFGFAVRRQWHA